MVLDSKKISWGILVLGGAAVVLALILVLFFRGPMQTPGPIVPAPGQQNGGGRDEEKQIVRQEHVYGLTGTVRAVDEAGAFFTFETVALPYSGFQWEAGETWTWSVEVATDTQFVLVAVNPEAQGEEAAQNYTETEATLGDMSVGDRVSVTAKEDIVSQFPLSEKRMQAARVEIISLSPLESLFE